MVYGHFMLLLALLCCNLCTQPVHGSQGIQTQYASCIAGYTGDHKINHAQPQQLLDADRIKPFGGLPYNKYMPHPEYFHVDMDSQPFGCCLTIRDLLQLSRGPLRVTA